MALRPLNPREKLLLGAMGLVVFVLANLFGLSTILEQRKRLAARVASLQIQDREARSILQEKKLWFERADWLRENQPVDDANSTDDENKFYEQLEQSAARHGVKIVKREFLPPAAPEAGGEVVPVVRPFEEFAVQLTVTAGMESLVKWMSSLQQPTRFLALKRATLQIDPNDNKKLLGDLVVARWYRSSNASAPPPGS